MSDILLETSHAIELSDQQEAYNRRHGINSASILTVTDDERAGLMTDFLEERIRDKVVIEIGGGIGLLALHMSSVAKKVICIEANPAWTHTFLEMFYAAKPKNVTWIFGAAEEVAGMVRGDVALFVTNSDHAGMRRVAGMFAPVVIDVHEEILGKDHWSIKGA